MRKYLPLNQKGSRTKTFSQKYKNFPAKLLISQNSYAKKKRPRLHILPHLESSRRDKIRGNDEAGNIILSIPRFRNSDT